MTVIFCVIDQVGNTPTHGKYRKLDTSGRICVILKTMYTVVDWGNDI